MAIVVQIPPPLREPAGGRADVPVTGATVKAVLDDLVRQCPALGPKLFADGKLRPLWRAAIFCGLTFWGLPYLLNPFIGRAFEALHLAPGLTAALVAFVEAQYFAIALIPTILLALQ